MTKQKNTSGQATSGRATVKINAPSISAEQRQDIEQSLAALDPTWEEGHFKVFVPMDASTQEQLSHLVSMFPNGDVQLETSSRNIIMSEGGGLGFDPDYGSRSGPYASQLDDADSMQSVRD